MKFTFRQKITVLHYIEAETEEQAREILESNGWENPDDIDSPIRSEMLYPHKDPWEDFVDIKTSLKQADLISAWERRDYAKELYNSLTKGE